MVNIGDMLSMWTKREYKSSIHRVLNLGQRYRYLIVYFFNRNLDYLLDPLNGSLVKGKLVSVKEHLIKRTIESYKYKS